MSDLTWIILILVLWRLVIMPAVQGFRESGRQHRRSDQSQVGYTDYEEIKSD